jgi:hypothetical protein
MTDKLKKELAAFADLWHGGYFEGDPLDPFTKSGYSGLGYMSVLHATYLRCIKPYVNETTIALEIGPGRGAWTRTMLPAKEIYALDAMPESHNCFYEYLGNPQHVKYFQVKDFSCSELPDNHFTYMFTFGCLCHVSFEGISQYAFNTYSKMKHGSDCFWMVADYDKYNRAMKTHLPERQHMRLDPEEDHEPVHPGRWYHAGIDWTCAILEQAGYRIVDRDVGTILRDPIIHFRKE